VITLRFGCGHTQRWAEGDGEPRCGQCGDTRVSRVTAPPPRITGAARGPYVVTEKTS
jgi:hypothetical protein